MRPSERAARSRVWVRRRSGWCSWPVSSARSRSTGCSGGWAAVGARILLWMAICIPAFFLLTMPLRPLFIADHPIPLALVTGSYAAIGAGGALASVGQETFWVVLLAGVIGKIKIDWLFWWLGRRW